MHTRTLCRHCGGVIKQCRCPGIKTVDYGCCSNWNCVLKESRTRVPFDSLLPRFRPPLPLPTPGFLL